MAQPRLARVSQPCPIRSLLFSAGEPLLAMEGREKLSLIKERLRAVKGFNDCPSANMADPSLDRTQLEGIYKGEHESFKGYAQRWKDMAAQVTPPMMEKKLIAMIVDTLTISYYEKMIGYMPSSFTDLVVTGERIEVGLGIGKFNCLALTSKETGANRKKERGKGTRVLTTISTWLNFPPTQQCPYSTDIDPSRYPPPNQPQSLPATRPMRSTTFSANQNTNQGRNFAKKKRGMEFMPIPVSYADLLPYLLHKSMVAMTPTKVPQPPFHQGYDPNATCAYHGRAPGHSIEHCKALKHKV